MSTSTSQAGAGDPTNPSEASTSNVTIAPEPSAQTTPNENASERPTTNAGPGEGSVKGKERQIKVWKPNDSAGSMRQDLPDSFFQPTAMEAKVMHASRVAARVKLTDSPLKTRAIREREEAERKARWPITKIRVKFPDRTQIETSFQSIETLPALYDFVRSTLAEDTRTKSFVLYQAPPRREFRLNDVKLRGQTLADLGFAPSSLLMIRFDEESLNDAASVPPLAPDLLEQATELPTPPPIQVESQNDKDKGKGRTSNTLSGEKGTAGGSAPKLPKWFKGPAKK